MMYYSVHLLDDIDCVNMYSINNIKIIECLVVAVSRLVWKRTQKELHCTFTCHKWNAGQNHNINITNKSFENILQCI